MYLDSLDSYYSIDHNELKQKTKPKKDNDRTIGKIFLVRRLLKKLRNNKETDSHASTYPAYFSRCCFPSLNTTFPAS